MLLYLTVVQTIALFSSHLMPTKISSSVLTALIVLFYTSVGGYSLHLKQIPFYWSWMEILSPERWLMPVFTADEYSPETLANTAAQQRCRNRQVININQR